MNSRAITQNPIIEGTPSSAELNKILSLQNRVLEKVTQDTDADQLFDQICRYIEHAIPDCVVTIMLLDQAQQHLNLACAPSVPAEAAATLNGLIPGVGAGSCGTSVFLGSPVYVVETGSDNRWDQLRGLATQLGIRACWSYPVRIDSQEIAGTIAISSFKPRTPLAFHALLLEAAASIVGIILKRQRSQQHIEDKELLLQNITKSIPGVIYQSQLDAELNQSFNYIGPGIETITGISADDAVKDFDLIWKQVHPEDKPGLLASMIHASQQLVSWSHEFRIYHKNGDLHWVRGSSSPEIDEKTGITRWNGVFLDITPEKSSIEQLRLAGIAFSSTNEGIMIADRGNKIIDVNRAFVDITGYSRDELINNYPTLLKSERHSEDFYQSIWNSLNQEHHWQGEIWNRRKNGEVVPHWANINAVHDPKSGELTHYVSVIADISNIKASEEKLSHLAHHDALTNLPNRLLFSARLDHALTHRSDDEKIVMLHLDLDRFKHINDTLGHRYGDQLLIEVTERLINTLSDKDTIARVGGDEFAILVESQEHAADAASIADQVVSALEQPFELDGKTFFTTASIGVALAPDHGEDIDTLTKHADIALNQAKDIGRNNYAFFQPELSETVEEWIKLEPELRNALKQNHLSLHYQPQMDNSGANLIGAEALIRWKHPVMGNIPPIQFLPIAEEIGLMLKIGNWVLETAIAQLAEWRKMGLDNFRLSINLASEQITKQDLPNTLHLLLEKYHVPAEMIELEILETFLLEHEKEATATFEALKAMGVGLALDDFGTGYSSLSYLKRLPINKVKIDRSLVRDIPDDPNDEAITKAVILLSHTLDLTVCAEGVETTAQRTFLEHEGCDQLQGFLFGKPVDAAEFSKTLQDRLSPIL